MRFGCCKSGVEVRGLDGGGDYLDEVVRLRGNVREIRNVTAQLYLRRELLVVRRPWLSAVRCMNEWIPATQA